MTSLDFKQLQLTGRPFGTWANELIIPHLEQLLDLNKKELIIDFGCGLGHWLHPFYMKGYRNILGIDLPEVEKHFVLNKKFFTMGAVDDPLNNYGKAKLALCIEVGEHIKASHSMQLVNNLVNHSNVVMFSAAIPGQGGINHINEQWPQYWIDIFNSFDYEVIDVLRWLVWDSPQVAAAYKNNLLLFVHKEKAEAVKKKAKQLYGFDPQFRFVVHPELFGIKVGHPINSKEF